MTPKSMRPAILAASLCLGVRLSAALLLQQDPATALPSENTHSEPVRVLVFGDSWGALGPSWTMLVTMFHVHGIRAQVESTAVSGTTACQWAGVPRNLAAAANLKFPMVGPHFVWLTLGGNDLLTESYVDCSEGAQAFEYAIRCAYDAAKTASSCLRQLLNALWEVFPRTQVVQCGYDFQCAHGDCIPFKRWPWCGHNVTCASEFGMMWARHMLDPLVDSFPAERYRTVAVDGACQVAGGVPHSRVGSPNLNRGSPCEMMIGCEHPAPDSKASYMIGEAFWGKFFRDRISWQKPAMSATPPAFFPVPRWELQRDTVLEDVRCNAGWVPDLESGRGTPPPCNRTYFSMSEAGFPGQGAGAPYTS